MLLLRDHSFGEFRKVFAVQERNFDLKKKDFFSDMTAKKGTDIIKYLQNEASIHGDIYTNIRVIYVGGGGQPQ